MTYNLGLDIGSTTIKAIVLDENDDVIYKSYERHKSRVREMAYDKIKELESVLANKEIKVAITGSAGHGIATIANIDLVQEVFATTKAVKQYLPQSDVVIELGGEDAKIIFLKGALEERMNSTCAGGTGAFIDQMASLLNLDLETLDKLSLQHTKLYPIASRCGVFAKTDVQPLINQGADKSNIAASIFQAVVDQTITGLAQGRRIEGNILFLGGPLSFNKGLRQRFIETLKLKEEQACLPELAPYFVALGAAVFSQNNKKVFSYNQLKEALYKSAQVKISQMGLPPLFENDEQYLAFNERHNQADVNCVDLATYTQDAYLGIDAGSTTTKTVLLDNENNILYSNYTSNQGNPIDVVKEQLNNIYTTNPNLNIKSSAVTGYGEELIKEAFKLDSGVVETLAHFNAAKHFQPNVDFIIDIGGQDMKCFKIKNNRIDEIILNEACSSGCGSFIETFSKSLGYDIKAFAQMGLMGKNPVDLGSRCTVFMNSSVKEAQKNGASVEDISAGLALSVVKNALYKVIRIKDPEELGDNIVVQGGTFLNDTVLRSFEIELRKDVVRPKISGLMGAYGAALIAKQRTQSTSSTISFEDLKKFTHASKATTCNACTNHCNLTINTFVDGKRLIAGNKCDRPVSGKEFKNDLPNVYRFKLDELYKYAENNKPGKRGKLGLPMVLNMYENLPFWHAFFTHLDFEVVISDQSSKALYNQGQHTIPSDTVCYPAKLVHGHIFSLINKKVDTIFYPALTYNFDEGLSDNCFNCPIVAYYPENVSSNIDMDNIQFLFPFISLNNQKDFIQKIYKYFKENNLKIKKSEIKEAAILAYKEYYSFKNKVQDYTLNAIKFAKDNHKYIIVLAGRPYHIDPEINHGLANVISSLDCVILSEDSIIPEKDSEQRNVLNQWTYHARLYQAAKFVSANENCELIQLVSFGCGLDSITSDEIREILKDSNKLYTQIKIDEIDNLGAAKIRIRSLLAAMNSRGENNGK